MRELSLFVTPRVLTLGEYASLLRLLALCRSGAG